jgi:3-oxoacyl-[acyl-carrier protein] reductase
MDLGLTGKACLVAGASRGIGRAIAIGLAAEGARVCIVARASDGGVDISEAREAIDHAGPGPHASSVADVSTAAGAQRAVDDTLAAFGAIDVVIANVGKSYARSVAEMDDDDLARSLDTNLWSAARVVQRAMPHLRTSRGNAVLVSSVFGREAGGAPGYNVAKAAIIALGKALARDVAADGVRVNTVAPGSILFPGGGWDRRQQADPAGIADFVRRELPFGRFGKPDEVADAVVFLASARAAWISGACVVVDGAQSRAL